MAKNYNLSQMKVKTFFSLGLVAALAACTPKNTTISTTAPTQSSEKENIAQKEEPKPRWAPKKYDYKPSETRSHDLIHTKLAVSFDWNKTYVYGKAWLDLKPYFYASDELVLDAKGFDIHEVAIMKNGEKKPLKYDYDDMYLTIHLDKSYTRDETYQVYIDYTAKPNELNLKGSAAITEAKGLYFINPDGSDPTKPRQIWTQGETEGSSCWFPTIDAPNERTTQEIAITVSDNFKTLSNGVLIKSEASDDGIRTDYWKQSLPHAPYLFAMAIGEFSVVKDEWRGREVSYYVEPEFEKYARLVFGNTPEMIEFYSKTTGFDYPWEKYSQVVVRDFVSGAMENTTCVIHFDQLQHDSREHIDSPMEDIIAHELFHHWFGDLVTCESWANLPLNESFATYGEYLWNEYKYGKDEADYKLYGNLKLYLAEANGKREPLIRYNMRHRDDMFDGHSYQKGSRVLHMLRNEVGDDAFFEAVKLYLEKNAYKPAEIHNLRLAFEEVSGRDMNWFFNQWFLGNGHPELFIEHGYADGTATIEVQQKQNIEYSQLFRLPMKVEIVTNGKSEFHDIVFESGDSTFTFDCPSRPDYVVFDADQMLLADIKDEDKPTDQWLAQLKGAKTYLQKRSAMEALSSSVDNPDVYAAVIEALDDEFWGVRQRALSMLDTYMGENTLPIVQKSMDLVKNDPKSDVRRTAVRVMSNFAEEEISNESGGAQANSLKAQVREALVKAVQDSSYSVLSEGLKSLMEFDREAGLAQAKALEKETNGKVVAAIASIYMDNDLPEAMPFVAKKLMEMKDGFGKFALLNSYGEYLGRQEAENQQKGLKVLMDVGANAGAWWIRLGAIRAMLPFRERAEVQDFLKQQLEKETQENLVQFIQSNIIE